MEQLAIAKRLQEHFPEEVLDISIFHGQVGVVLKRDRIREILLWLRDGDKIRLNHLMCLCGVDNATRMTGRDNLSRFEVVYNLFSITHNHELRLRAQVPEADPTIDSVTRVWAGADWPERECYDLLGITFNGHPNMKRILLPDDWPGHPLRKEYPLRGREEWSGFSELLGKVEELRQYDFTPDRPSKG